MADNGHCRLSRDVASGATHSEPSASGPTSVTPGTNTPAGARPRSGAYYSLARQAQTGAIAEAGTPQGTDYDSPARVRVSSGARGAGTGRANRTPSVRRAASAPLDTRNSGYRSEPNTGNRKRRKIRAKKGDRRRAVANAPSDVWASIFQHLPDLPHALPRLRLVCRQFNDVVSARVVQELRPQRDINDARLSHLLQRFPIVQLLDLADCHRLTGSFLRELEPHISLKTLILDRCPGTFQPRMANYWMYLNSSDNLQHLSMADNFFVSDEDLHVLCELEKLLSLNFSGCAQIEDEGLATFSGAPAFTKSLTRLEMARLPKVTDEGLLSVSALTSLVRLDLSHTAQLTRTGLSALHPLRSLTKLNLSGCDKLSWAGAALALAPLTQLVELDLSYIGEAPPDDEDVATTRELRDGNGGIGYSTWADIYGKELTRLQSLRLPGCGLTDFDLLGLRPLTHLTLLDICDSQEVTVDGFASLLSFKNLKELSLESCITVNDDVVKSLVQLHGLTNLNLSSCDEVTDDGLQSLAALTDLDSLNAVDCGISDEGIVELQKALPRLSIAYTRESEDYWVWVSDDEADEDDDAVWELIMNEGGDSDEDEDGDEAAIQDDAGANAAAAGWDGAAAPEADAGAPAGGDAVAVGSPEQAGDAPALLPMDEDAASVAADLQQAMDAER